MINELDTKYSFNFNSNKIQKFSKKKFNLKKHLFTNKKNKFNYFNF